MKLQSLAFWKKREPKDVFPQVKHRITEAFKSGGVQYYKFDDLFNLPYQRGMAALDVYTEANMKCDRDFLKAFTEANNTILTGNKIGLSEMAQLKKNNDILRERLDYVAAPDLLYKVASVVYFDATENPYKYDSKYCMEKVERWKKEMSVDDFFLQQPIRSLFPFLEGAVLNFAQYSEMLKEMTEAQRSYLSDVISQKDKPISNNKTSASSAKGMQAK